MCVLCRAANRQRQSAYALGWGRTVADMSLKHPSSFKQHVVIKCVSAELAPLSMLRRVFILA
jgi:hypothetical protein